MFSSFLIPPSISFSFEKFVFILYAFLSNNQARQRKPYRISALIKARCLSSALLTKASFMGFRSCFLYTASVSDGRPGQRTTGGSSVFSVHYDLALLHTYKTTLLFESILSTCNLQVDPSFSRSDVTTRCRRIDPGDNQPNL